MRITIVDSCYSEYGFCSSSIITIWSFIERQKQLTLELLWAHTSTHKERHCSVPLYSFVFLGNKKKFSGLEKFWWTFWQECFWCFGGGGVDHNVAIFYVNLKYLKMTILCASFELMTSPKLQIELKIKYFEQVGWINGNAI